MARGRLLDRNYQDPPTNMEVAVIQVLVKTGSSFYNTFGEKRRALAEMALSCLD